MTWSQIFHKMCEKDVKIAFVLHYRENPRKMGKFKHPELTAGLVTIHNYFLLPKIRNLKKENPSHFLIYVYQGSKHIFEKIKSGKN